MEFVMGFLGCLAALALVGQVGAAAGLGVLGTGLNIAGGLIAAGDKPNVPEVPPLDIGKEQREAIGANLQAFEKTSKLAKRVDRFNRQQFEQTIKDFFPEFSDTAEQISKNIAAQAQGQIPQDVSEAVQRSAAAQAVEGGFAGSGLQRNLVARDLGTTSLQLTNQALDSASRWLQTVRSQGPQTFDITSTFVSPQQAIAAQQSTRQLQFQRDLLAAGVEAAPDPQDAVIGGALQGLGSSLTSVGTLGLGQAAGANVPQSSGAGGQNFLSGINFNFGGGGA